MHVAWLRPDMEIRGFGLNCNSSIGACQEFHSNEDHYITIPGNPEDATLPETKMEITKRPYKDYSSFLKGAIICGFPF